MNMCLKYVYIVCVYWKGGEIMNLEAEKRKIQKLNKTELRKYEEENLKLLAAAKEKVLKADEERKNAYKQTVFCRPGTPDELLLATVKAYSERSRLEKLNSEIQKRKLAFLTPQEKRAREAKRKALLKQIEELRA